MIEFIKILLLCAAVCIMTGVVCVSAARQVMEEMDAETERLKIERDEAVQKAHELETLLPKSMKRHGLKEDPRLLKPGCEECNEKKCAKCMYFMLNQNTDEPCTSCEEYKNFVHKHRFCHSCGRKLRKEG